MLSCTLGLAHICLVVVMVLVIGTDVTMDISGSWCTTCGGRRCNYSMIGVLPLVGPVLHALRRARTSQVCAEPTDACAAFRLTEVSSNFENFEIQFLTDVHVHEGKVSV